MNPFLKVVRRSPALAAKVRKVTLVGSGSCTPATSDDEGDGEDEDGGEGAGYAQARNMHHLGRLKWLFGVCNGLEGVELCGVVCWSLTDLDGAEREFDQQAELVD